MKFFKGSPLLNLQIDLPWPCDCRSQNSSDALDALELGFLAVSMSMDQGNKIKESEPRLKEEIQERAEGKGIQATSCFHLLLLHCSA